MKAYIKNKIVEIYGVKKISIKAPKIPVKKVTIKMKFSVPLDENFFINL